MSEPVGVILAAGLATRMGRPKQLLPFGASTVLGTVVATVKGSKLGRVVVVLGAYADEILADTDLSGLEVVINPEPERGNLSSLRVALASVGDAPVLLIMGDMPGLEPELIDAHLDAYRGEPAWLQSTSYLDGVGHPFLLSPELLSNLDGLDGPKPLWHLAMSERAGRLSVPARMPTDIDTPADYGEALARDSID